MKNQEVINISIRQGVPWDGTYDSYIAGIPDGSTVPYYQVIRDGWVNQITVSLHPFVAGGLTAGTLGTIGCFLVKNVNTVLTGGFDAFNLDVNSIGVMAQASCTYAGDVTSPDTISVIGCKPSMVVLEPVNPLAWRILNTDRLYTGLGLMMPSSSFNPGTVVVSVCITLFVTYDQ